MIRPRITATFSVYGTKELADAEIRLSTTTRADLFSSRNTLRSCVRRKWLFIGQIHRQRVKDSVPDPSGRIYRIATNRFDA